jgi:hypothetical protein
MCTTTVGQQRKKSSAGEPAPCRTTIGNTLHCYHSCRSPGIMGGDDIGSAFSSSPCSSMPAVVTTIWGGPTYVEFAIRSWRLMKKEHFNRPLGQSSRWKFDILHWACVITIAAVTALFIVGSAPHIVFLRVLCMPGPAILYSLGGVLFVITMWSLSGRPAPFRISSTPKGGVVHPGVYYFIEDVIAVNANAGRPFREALAARYESSPPFRKMIWKQSLFWSIPSIVLAIPLTAIAVVHSVPATVAYGICESSHISVMNRGITLTLDRLGCAFCVGCHLGYNQRHVGAERFVERSRGMGIGQRRIGHGHERRGAVKSVYESMEELLVMRVFSRPARVPLSKELIQQMSMSRTCPWFV